MKTCNSDQSLAPQHERAFDAQEQQHVCPAPVLSVVMPVYNESATLATIVKRVQSIEIPHELIIVDDGSCDGTGELIDSFGRGPAVVISRNSTNQGKGAALRAGFIPRTKHGGNCPRRRSGVRPARFSTARGTNSARPRGRGFWKPFLAGFSY